MWRLKNEIVWWVKAVFNFVMGIIFIVPFMTAMYFVSKENNL